MSLPGAYGAYLEPTWSLPVAPCNNLGLTPLRASVDAWNYCRYYNLGQEPYAWNSLLMWTPCKLICFYMQNVPTVREGLRLDGSPTCTGTMPEKAADADGILHRRHVELHILMKMLWKSMLSCQTSPNTLWTLRLTTRIRDRRCTRCNFRRLT